MCIDEYSYLLMSIDPGTDKMGVTISGITSDGVYQPILSHTVDVGKLTRWYYTKEEIELRGHRACKTALCGRVVYSYACAWGVNVIVSESPYMGRFAAAFQALTECISAIKDASYSYNPFVGLRLIDPSTIKNSVGVSGTSGDKDLMKLAVSKLVDFDTCNLDEHSIDSIAVGYAWYRSEWKKEIH